MLRKLNVEQNKVHLEEKKAKLATETEGQEVKCDSEQKKK